MQGRRWLRAAVAGALLGGGVLAGGGAAGGAPASEPTSTSGTFTALTYNVAGLPEPLSGSEPDINTPYISPLLNGYDLVLVQEDWIDPDPPIPGFDFHHDDLVADATHPYQSVPAPPPIGTNPDRPTALVADGLNRLSRFPFGEVTRVMWPSCFGGADTSDGGAGDCLSEKGFSVARTTFAPGVEVDVYNLHAEAGSTPADEAASAEDYEVLAAFIRTHSAGRAVIVGGDFNLHTDRPVDAAVHAEFLHEAGLTDVCEVVDCGADVHRIDRFAFRGGSGVVLEPLTHRFERDVFVRPTDGAPLSDHLALAVTFSWSVDTEADGSISGTVTSAGGPVAGAQVWAFRPTDVWIGAAVTSTDAEGRYRIDGLDAGTYQLVFSAPAGSGLVTEWAGDAALRQDAEPTLVTPGGTSPGVDAELAGGAVVAGTVAGPDGPVAGATVWAFAPEDRWLGRAVATTDADGSYVLPPLADDTYRLQFVPPAGSGLAPEWHEDAPSRSAATPITVATGSGPTTITVDAALTPAP